MSHLWKPYVCTRVFQWSIRSIRVSTEVFLLVILVFYVPAAFGKSCQVMCVLLIIVCVCYEDDSSEWHHHGGMGILKYLPHFKNHAGFLIIYPQYIISIVWHLTVCKAHSRTWCHFNFDSNILMCAVIPTLQKYWKAYQMELSPWEALWHVECIHSGIRWILIGISKSPVAQGKLVNIYLQASMVATPASKTHVHSDNIIMERFLVQCRGTCQSFSLLLQL